MQKQKQLWGLFVLIAMLVGAVAPPIGVQARQALAPDVSPDIVISQVYGGGGNTGATYKNDFIELFNRGNTTIDITGWSVQYASSTGSTWNLTTLSGSIAPGMYYLVQEAAGAGGTVDLPTPDATGSIAMAGSNGKVALVNNNTALSGSCPTGVVDLVGYGTANCSEGAPAPALTNTTAAIRNSNGCVETDNNSADFTTGAPTPRNSSSPSNSCAGDNAPTVLSTSPADNATNVLPAQNIVLTFSEAVDVTGDWFQGTCTTSGTGGPAEAPATTSNNITFTLNPFQDMVLGETCTLTIFASLVNDQDEIDPPDNMAADYTFDFTVTEDFTLIHEIQGPGTVSPLVDANVAIEGIVVGDFQGSTGLRGFFVQEEDVDVDADPLTSEGIFVYDNTFGVDVAVGDRVQVAGKVIEFNTFTEISPVTAVAVVTSGNPLPTPARVTLPEEVNGDLERYEGMYVEIVSEMTVAQNYFLGRYGQLTLSASGRLFTPTNQYRAGTPEAIDLADFNARSLLFLDDGSLSQNPNPVPYLGTAPGMVLRAGDKVGNLKGVLDYNSISSNSSLRDYRLHPTVTPVFTNTNTRPTEPENVLGLNGSLKVASANTLNYFVTLDGAAGDVCGPTGGMECRGADTPSEFTRQQDKLVSALCTVGADIVGLMEIENPNPANDTVAGDGINDYVLQTLTTALNSSPICVTAGITYTFTDDTFGGTDAIRQAIVYNSNTVAPVGSPSFALLTEEAFLNPLGGSVDRNRPALAQTFEEKANGAVLTVVVNHLKSKGGACSEDPDAGDGQGNCNEVRAAAADYLANVWLPTDPTGSNDPDFLIIGDLNAYANEDPVWELLNSGYTDLVQFFEGSQSYSYIFDGLSGYLDHALSSATLTRQVTGATQFHINADEPTVIDYDQNFNPPGYYTTGMYRSSDHDMVVVGLDLNPFDWHLFLPLIFR